MVCRKCQALSRSGFRLTVSLLVLEIFYKYSFVHLWYCCVIAQFRKHVLHGPIASLLSFGVLHVCRVISQFQGLACASRHCSVSGSCVHDVSLLSFGVLRACRVIAQFRQHVLPARVAPLLSFGVLHARRAIAQFWGLARVSRHCSVLWTCASTVCNRSVMAKGVAWKVVGAGRQMCRCSMSWVIAQFWGLTFGCLWGGQSNSTL